MRTYAAASVAYKAQMGATEALCFSIIIGEARDCD